MSENLPATHGTAEELPLSGVRILEFGHTVMGPSCSMVLADLGADVIKKFGRDGAELAVPFQGERRKFFHLATTQAVCWSFERGQQMTRLEFCMVFSNAL